MNYYERVLGDFCTSDNMLPRFYLKYSKCSLDGFGVYFSGKGKFFLLVREITVLIIKNLPFIGRFF
jgi:hypothetical protein